jgi:hypothetical protein
MPNTQGSGTPGIDSDDETYNFDPVAGGAAAAFSAPPLTRRPTYLQAHSAFQEAHTEFSSILESMVRWSYQVDPKLFTPADEDECPIYSLGEELSKTVDSVRPLFEEIILQSRDLSQEMTASDHQLAATYLLMMLQSLEILKKNGKLYPALYGSFQSQVKEAHCKLRTALVASEELRKKSEVANAECAQLRKANEAAEARHKRLFEDEKQAAQKAHNLVLSELQKKHHNQLAVLREEVQFQQDKVEAIKNQLKAQLSEQQKSAPPKSQPPKPTPKTEKTADPVIQALKAEVKSHIEQNKQLKQELTKLRTALSKKPGANTQTAGAPSLQPDPQIYAESERKDAKIAALSAQIATITQALDELQKRFDQQSSDFSAHLAAVYSKDQELEKMDQELEKLRAECSYLHQQIQYWRYQYNLPFTPWPTVAQVCRDPAAPRGTLANPGRLFGGRGGNIGSGNGQAAQSYLAGGRAAASGNRPTP